MDIRSNDGCVDALIENATLTNSSSTGALIIGFDSEALDTLKTAAICSAFLSICGSSFVIMTYHLMRVHKPLVLSLLYWLSVTDLISSLVYIIDGLSANADLMSCEPFTFCVFKAMLHQVLRQSVCHPCMLLLPEPSSDHRVCLAFRLSIWRPCCGRAPSLSIYTSG